MFGGGGFVAIGFTAIGGEGEGLLPKLMAADGPIVVVVG
jgi:hypothetical protein